MLESIYCDGKGMLAAILVASLFGALIAYDLMHGYVGMPM
jgi:hypothetical protein